MLRRWLRVLDRSGDLGARQPSSNVTPGITAHPVRDDVESKRVVDEERVLVTTARHAHVGLPQGRRVDEPGPPRRRHRGRGPLLESQNAVVVRGSHAGGARRDVNGGRRLAG